MARSIDNTEDVIDSRDVIARIEELDEKMEGAREDAAQALFGRSFADDLDAEQVKAVYAKVGGEFGGLDDDEIEEIRALRMLAQQGRDYCADWEHGEALIRESYFERYAMELADDIGAINREATWPNNCIDWERAARELLIDYTSLDFDGVTYYVRS